MQKQNSSTLPPLLLTQDLDWSHVIGGCRALFLRFSNEAGDALSLPVDISKGMWHFMFVNRCYSGGFVAWSNKEVFEKVLSWFCWVWEMVLAHLVGRWEPGHLAVMADVSFVFWDGYWACGFLDVRLREATGWFLLVAGGNWLIWSLISEFWRLRNEFGDVASLECCMEFSSNLDFSVGRCSRTLTFGARFCEKLGRPFLARCGEFLFLFL